MTTEEFIKKVNSLSEDERNGLVAFLKNNGVPAIADAKQFYTLAYLPGYTKRWVFAADSYSFPGCVLKLMGELADSKYRERQKQYVILNGEPYHDIRGELLFDCFVINVHECLETANGLCLSELVTYTKSELNEHKANMPWTMKEAIDALTVPLEEAEKMGEDNDN